MTNNFLKYLDVKCVCSMFGVLLLHSFGSTKIEFQEFVDYLEGQGFRTIVPSIPGYGSFPKDLENFTYKEWLKASENALKELNCQVTFIIGQTTGAPLALSLAAKHPELLGIVTISGIINLPRWSMLYRPFIKYRPSLIKWESLSSRVIPFYNEKIGTKTYQFKNVPHKSLNEIFRLIQHTRRILHKVIQPIYVFHPSTARELDAHYIFEEVSSNKKKLKFIEKGGPIMSIDLSRWIIFQETTHFLWNCINLYQM